MKDNYRYIAQIIIEAATPLSIGSGESHLVTDSPVFTDANGIPMIPGTSLCGVLRHSLERFASFDINKVFGFQDQHQPENSEGSRIIISSAHPLDENGQAIEGLLSPNQMQSEYYKKLAQLPIREHCRINEKGVSDKEAHGKFDQQVAYKGMRFCFEIELIGTKEDENIWNQLLSLLSHPAFRIGGGSRKGFGEIQVLTDKSFIRIFDLTQAKDREDYLKKSSSLKAPLQGKLLTYDSQNSPKDWIHYELSLMPEESWLFGSGFSDEEADMTPVYEPIIIWNNNNQASFSAQRILVPATSVKGAISHRLSYHYNRIEKKYIDKIDKKQIPSFIEENTAENNKAVCTLFGCAKNSKTEKGQIGNALFSDMFLEDRNQTKILNHVAIDRYTGGTIDGALFNEKVLTQKETFILHIFVHQDALQDKNIKEAWEATLQDITQGQLPLGGGVMRGHGAFHGTCNKKEETA